MKNYYFRMNSPVGILHLISNGKKLSALLFDKNWKEYSRDLELLEEKDAVIRQAEAELKEYFAGGRKKFSVPVELSGTEFQNSAWKELMTIPFGETRTYSEQAKNIRRPKAVRAIGSANGKNKICIIVPCHRVIGADGSLTGFGGGIEIKEKLLKLENAL